MENRNWFSHIESVVILITILVGYFMIDSKFDTVNSRFDSINSRFDQYMIASHEEMKDFHGRLCAIEARWHNQKPKTDP
jgi:hypothetical protein